MKTPSEAPSTVLKPMEARLVAEMPTGPGWQFEPKWDGFRCLVMKSGGTVSLQAKSGKPLGRYFPEIVAAFEHAPLRSLKLDGELVIELEGRLSFDDLQMRLHPAASRIARLAQETPATFIAFDALSDLEGKPIAEQPLLARRKALEAIIARIGNGNTIRMTRMTTERRVALRWLKPGSPAVDGVVAKRLDLPYLFGERAMLKVKPIRTADCVVGGFRYGEGSRLVGSLLLGLYDEAGELHHVGFTSALSDSEKPALTKTLEKLIRPPGFTANVPGAPSRWSNGRSAAWEPLKPKLVVEVRFDQVTNGRFRHGTQLVRWRPDKTPKQCTFEQIAPPRSARGAFAF